MLKRSLILTLGASIIAVLSCVAFVTHKADQKLYQTAQEKPLFIIIPSYNNAQWCVKNLDSIVGQEYENYRVFYISDAPTDNQSEVVTNYIKKRGIESRVTLIENKINAGAMANIYNVIHNFAHDNEIVLTIDGDDWLENNQVFKTINSAYANPQVWMTYGNYTHWPEQSFKSTCDEIPSVVIQHNAYRRYAWKTSHLRTFYAGLFKKIKKEDLCDNDGFYRVTWDQAFMFPMLEMASGRWKYIPEVLYVYNVQNPLNDFKVRLRQQLATEREIRSKKPYERLESL